jgi:hypothetical protein
MVPGIGVVQHELSLAGCANTHPPSNKAGRRIDSVPAIRSTARLAGGHCFRRSHRQLQDLAQCAQIRITWPTVICLPEIDARLADTDLLGNFSDRQATLNAGVPQITRQTWFTRQASNSFSIKRKAPGTYCCLQKKSTGPGNRRTISKEQPLLFEARDLILRRLAHRHLHWPGDDLSNDRVTIRISKIPEYEAPLTM